MTTKVTVDAHAGWPVKVTPIENGVEGSPSYVEANKTQDFYVWQGKDLLIHECEIVQS